MGLSQKTFQPKTAHPAINLLFHNIQCRLLPYHEISHPKKMTYVYIIFSNELIGPFGFNSFGAISVIITQHPTLYNHRSSARLRTHSARSRRIHVSKLSPSYTFKLSEKTDPGFEFPDPN